MSNILVTGGAGFLGSHLAERLIQLGHSVTVVDNLTGGTMDNVPKGAVFFEGDTSDFRLMDFILRLKKIEIVYHCACTAHEGLSVFSPKYITDNTFGNTLGILTAFVRNEGKRFVYCSSMSRYGVQETPYTEEMEPKPNDPYAVAKVACERILALLADTHKFEYAIAIPHNIIGARQKYDDPFRNVASIMINRILQGKEPIIYGDGEQIRSFSYVEDCVESLVRMIDCPSGGIYNIGPDEKDTTVTINDLARLISDEIGVKIEPIYYPDRPREVKKAFCSSAKIRKEFGYRTKTSLREALREMIADIRKKGPRPFQYNIELEIKNEKTPKTWLNKEI